MDGPRLAFCRGALLLLGFALGAAPHVRPQEVRFTKLNPELLQARLRLIARENAERVAVLRKLFEASGCAGAMLTEQIVERKRPPNLVCTLPGESDSVILVGAHSDHAERGRGVIDDWSGASLLPSLFEAMKDTQRKHTYVFVAFADEELGLRGSEFFVRQLKGEPLKRIRAMVNLECLGLGPTNVWTHQADRELLRALGKVAASLSIPVHGVSVDNVGKDDATSFAARKVATITIHSVTQQTLRLLHSDKDDFAAIKPENYYESYLLIATYLAYLDIFLP